MVKIGMLSPLAAPITSSAVLEEWLSMPSVKTMTAFGPAGRDAQLSGHVLDRQALMASRILDPLPG